jgi:hypothetical protein
MADPEAPAAEGWEQHQQLTSDLHAALDAGDSLKAQRLDSERSALSVKLNGDGPVVGANLTTLPADSAAQPAPAEPSTASESAPAEPAALDLGSNEGALAALEGSVGADAASALAREWGSELSTNMRFARAAFESLSPSDRLVEKLERDGLGSDPEVLRFLARHGRQQAVLDGQLDDDFDDGGEAA